MRGQGERAEEGVEGGGQDSTSRPVALLPLPPGGASTRELSLVVAHDKSYSFGPVQDQEEGRLWGARQI